MTVPNAVPPEAGVQAMAMPMVRLLLRDIPRPGEFGNRDSYALAAARYCEALAGWIGAAAAAEALTPERIIEIRDEHLPSQGESFDCVAFANAIVAAARARALLPWRHVKTGAVYDIIAHAKMETTGTPVVVYRGESGTWVRPALEFYDGRFERAE